MKTFLVKTSANVDVLENIFSKIGVELDDNQLSNDKEENRILKVEYDVNSDKIVLSTVPEYVEFDDDSFSIQVLLYNVFKEKGIERIRTTVTKNDVQHDIFSMVSLLDTFKLSIDKTNVIFSVDDLNDCIFYPKFSLVKFFTKKGTLFLDKDEFVGLLALFNIVCDIPKEVNIFGDGFIRKKKECEVPKYIFFTGDMSYFVDEKYLKCARYKDTNVYNNIKRLMLVNDFHSYFLEIRDGKDLDLLKKFVQFKELDLAEQPIDNITLHFVMNKCEINNEVFDRNFVYGNRYFDNEHFYKVIVAFLNIQKEST